MRAIFCWSRTSLAGSRAHRCDVDSYFVAPSQPQPQIVFGYRVAGAAARAEFIDVRGNVPTRVRKLFQLMLTGLVVAKAAIDRLLEAEQDEFAETRAELRNALSQCHGWFCR